MKPSEQKILSRSLATTDERFDSSGNGFRGSVFPHLTFILIKGLEKYARNDLARECSIRHLYYILDTLHPGREREKAIFMKPMLL